MKSELVYNWMNREVITVTPDTAVSEANEILRKYAIRRLPVINHENNLVGIVTLGDIREASASAVPALKVSGLPVIDPADETLVGIITESDIFRVVVQKWDEPVTEEMQLA